MMMMMMMTTMMLSPKTHRTYKVIVTRRPEMHHCSYNLRCSFQDKRVHLVTIRQRWHAVNLPWTNESSWKGKDRNEPSDVSTMCWSCALCFRKGSLKKSGADVFAWNKWCWRLLYTLYKLLCIYKSVCTPQNTHTHTSWLLCPLRPQEVFGRNCCYQKISWQALEKEWICLLPQRR